MGKPPATKPGGSPLEATGESGRHRVVGGLRSHRGEAGIGAVLNQAEFILVAQQLTIATNEGVALGLGRGGLGVEELGSHGSSCGRWRMEQAKDGQGCR